MTPSRRTCPYCCERLAREASACPHCQRDLVTLGPLFDRLDGLEERIADLVGEMQQWHEGHYVFLEREVIDAAAYYMRARRALVEGTGIGTVLLIYSVALLTLDIETAGNVFLSGSIFALIPFGAWLRRSAPRLRFRTVVGSGLRIGVITGMLGTLLYLLRGGSADALAQRILRIGLFLIGSICSFTTGHLASAALTDGDSRDKEDQSIRYLVQRLAQLRRPMRVTTSQDLELWVKRATIITPILGFIGVILTAAVNYIVRKGAP